MSEMYKETTGFSIKRLFKSFLKSLIIVVGTFAGILSVIGLTKLYYYMIVWLIGSEGYAAAITFITLLTFALTAILYNEKRMFPR